MMEMRHVDREIIEQSLPTPEDGFVFDHTSRHAPGRERNGVERRRTCITHPLNTGKR